MAKVVTFGELMLRLAPEGYLRFVQSDKYEATFGGAEANVAVSLANYGLHAAFVSKLPTHEITGGVLLNQKVTPAMLSTQENTKKLEFIVRTFFNRLEGYHVQYNVVDKATLLDAQAHPEKHKDLIVRVAGYSAFFNVLSKATQDDIIGRTEQTL